MSQGVRFAVRLLRRRPAFTAIAVLTLAVGIDPLVVAAAVVTLATVAMAAGSLPARRASRIEPMQALRWE